MLFTTWHLGGPTCPWIQLPSKTQRWHLRPPTVWTRAGHEAIPVKHRFWLVHGSGVMLTWDDLMCMMSDMMSDYSNRAEFSFSYLLVEAHTWSQNNRISKVAEHRTRCSFSPAATALVFNQMREGLATHWSTCTQEILTTNDRSWWFIIAWKTGWPRSFILNRH